MRDLSGNYCYSCGRKEPIPPQGAFAFCFECFHVYCRPRDLKLAYLQQSWWVFKADMKGKPKGGISLCREDGPDIFVPFEPPRFMRLHAAWFMIRSLFRKPSDITFCQECLHDF